MNRRTAMLRVTNCGLAIALCVVAGSLAAAGQYHQVRKFMIGGEGGWDYLTFDSTSGRLFISRGTHVMVVEGATGKVVGDIPDTPGVHGIALAPKLGRGFASNGRTNTVTIFDLRTLQVIAQVKTGENPDAVVYDPSSRRVFAMNGRSHSATVIDAATGTVAGTIDLGGKPEFAVADGRGRVYVNLEDTSELVALDSTTLKVLNRWPLAPCQEPSGLAIDRAHRRLFAGCRNKMMAVVDTESGGVVATPAIGAGVDGNGFDPGTGLAFSSNGEGTLTVVHEDSPTTYTVVENVETQPGARTMALDEKTHEVYLVTAEFGPRPASTPENPRPRPTIVPGSFVVLVYGK